MSGRIHDLDFEIFLIDENNVSVICGYLDKPNDEEFIFNTCWDCNAGLERSRFYNDFGLAVFCYHMLSYKNQQDILMGRFKIGCNFYDDVGNTYRWLFNSKFVLWEALFDHCLKPWSNRMTFFLRVDGLPQQEPLCKKTMTMKTMKKGLSEFDQTKKVMTLMTVMTEFDQIETVKTLLAAKKKEYHH